MQIYLHSLLENEGDYHIIPFPTCMVKWNKLSYQKKKKQGKRPIKPKQTEKPLKQTTKLKGNQQNPENTQHL